MEVKRQLSAWKIYKLLLRKNFLSLIRDKRHLIQMVLLPVLILMSFIILRLYFPEAPPRTQSYEALEFNKSWTDLIRVINYRKEYITQHNDGFDYNNFVPRTVLGYAPKSFEGLRNIMEMASLTLDSFELQAFADCDKLREEMKKKFFFAGVCFDDAEMLSLADDLYPMHLNFTIIFPYELRMYDHLIGAVWKTSRFLKEVTVWDYMKIMRSDHNHFFSEGFLHIQHAILSSYTSLITKSAWTGTVALKRFPWNDRHFDALLFGGRVWIPLAIIIAELYPVAYLTYAMVREKKTMKPLMKVMGVGNYLTFMVWITQGMVMQFSISLLLTLILKINWGADNAYLESTSVFVVLIFLFVYDLSALCFCFMMSAFLANLTNVTATTTFLWVISLAPFLFIIYREYISLPVKILLNLLPNTALASGFKIITEFETLNFGMGLENFFESPKSIEEITLGWFIVMMLGSAVLFIAIGLYVESLSWRSYHIYKAWTKFWNKRKQEPREPSITFTNRAAPMTAIQIDPEHKSISIELNNVCKQFEGTEVIRQVSMTLYENEITVLLGHNGCGKTTLLSMVAGLIKPNSGTIRAMGLSVSRYSHFIDYGIFIDNRMLFRNLTVEENLLFFTQLKGLDREETEHELVKYLDTVELSERRKTPVNQLSPGQRQLLAVCCALTGGSKIVILDEPFTYLDMFSRGKLVDLLNNEKTGRTIFMASHSCAIAEAIGDRIAIMSRGVIRCVGNSYFLRKLYGMGYILVILKGPLCRKVEVEKHIKKFIPNAAFHSEIGAEIAYLLESRHTSVFAALLEEIEANFEELNLMNCTIYENALDHIFFAWGDVGSSENSRERFIGILNGKTMYEEEYNNLLFMKNEFVRGSRLWFNQVKAMIRKRFLFDWYHKYYWLLQVLLMLIFVGYASFEKLKKTKFASDTISISLIEQRHITVVNSRAQNEVYKEVDHYYRQAIMQFGYPHILEDTHGEHVSDYIINKNVISRGYHVGATFTDDYILAWYSRFPLRTASLSLTMIYEAIVRAHFSSHTSIRLSHEKLALDQFLMNEHDPYGAADVLLALLSFFFIFKWSAVQIFIIQERVSDFKMIQFACGVSPSSFWIGALVYDLIKMMLLHVLWMLVICLVIGIHTFPASIIRWYFLLLCVCGFSVTLWNYVASMWFRDPLTAYMLTLIFHFVGGLIFCAMVVTLFPNVMKVIASDLSVIWLLRLWPLFSLCAATAKILYVYENQMFCATEAMQMLSITMENCKKEPNCCVDWQVWSWEHGIQPEILCLCLTALTFMHIFFIKENYQSWFIKFTRKGDIRSKYENDFEDHEWRHNVDNFSKEDEAVIKERLKVYRLSTNYLGLEPLVCDRLGKKIGGTAVIKNLSLSLDRGEAFGLLGVAGSGKSVFLKMLAGQEKIDCGEIYLHGINVPKRLTSGHRQIGLCPSNNPFMLEFRAKQVLEMIALIRGVRTQDVERVCENLVKVLGLFPYYNNQLLHYSLGSGRRLSFAMAMLGNSPILILDKASVGSDPSSRRCLWNILCRMKQGGATIVFSTDDAYECEVLANRVGFMSTGSFGSIGTINELNKRYSTGYVLTVKLSTELRQSRKNKKILSISSCRRAIVNYVENTFKDSSLKKYDGHQMFFSIPAEENSVNTIFDKMQRASYNLQVEDFQISRMNLGLVFNDFAEKQERVEFVESKINAKSF